MNTRSIHPVTLAAAAILWLAGTAASAQTSDGLPPANEGVCDELVDATPGLYGLCVAFCEAQDCDPDFSLEDPFANCPLGSQKLLENYAKRKGAGDPDMPCVQNSACPCWTPEELASLRYRDLANDSWNCLENFDHPLFTNMDTWTIQNNTALGAAFEYATTVVSIGNVTQASVSACRLIDRCVDGNCLDVDRQMPISPEQHANCEADVIASAELRGLVCTDPNP